MRSQEEKSEYTLKWSDSCGRMAIMRKDNGDVLESFSENVPQSLIIQRMCEIREDELLRNRLISGTSLDNKTAEGGIITDFSNAPVTQGGLII